MVMGIRRGHSVGDGAPSHPDAVSRHTFPTDVPGRPWFGLYVGEGTVGPVWAEPESSMLVVGPPRSGKTSRLVVPSVLDAPAALVSTSTKGDVLEATAFRRWALGNVFVFDPTGSTHIPDGCFPLRWSPVVGCDTFDAAVATAHALGSAGRPGAALTESAHWVERAEGLLAPLLFAANLGDRDMKTVCRWVLARDLREPLAALETSGHEMALVVLRGILGTEDRERSGIFSTASGIFRAYRSETALASTAHPNFDPAAFACSTDAVYICAPAHAQEQLAPLVVALLEQIRSAVYARPQSAAPVVFALDEVASNRAAAIPPGPRRRGRGTGPRDLGVPTGPLTGPGTVGRGGRRLLDAVQHEGGATRYRGPPDAPAHLRPGW